MAKRRGKNEGSISRLPSGRWRAQITQRKKRISFSSAAKSECQEWIRKMLDKIDRGLDFEGSKKTLNQFLPDWLNNNQASLRPKTADQYKRIIEKHILPHIGEVKLKDLRLDYLEEFYASLLTAGVGVRTVRLVHGVLHRSLEKAVRYGLVMRNPVQGASLPRYRHAEMMVLDETQVSQLLVSVIGCRNEALYHLAVTTGMRQGEIFGLKWSDLQWVSGRLYVQRQVQQVRGKTWDTVEPKTRSGKRVIKLGEGTLQKLREHKERQEVERKVAGDLWQDLDFIFSSSVGTPIDASNLRLDFHKVLDRAGLPKIRFHDLRHTAASLMLNHGVPVIVVSKMLGHSKPSITMDIYGHLYNEMQDEAAKLMDELVTPVLVNLDEKTGSNVK